MPVVERSKGSAVVYIYSELSSTDPADTEVIPAHACASELSNATMFILCVHCMRQWRTNAPASAVYAGLSTHARKAQCTIWRARRTPAEQYRAECSTGGLTLRCVVGHGSSATAQVFARSQVNARSNNAHGCTVHAQQPDNTKKW